MTRLESEAILFDLDGVLIDSSSCIRRHWREWAYKHNLDVTAIMRVAHGLRTVETMRIAAPHLDAEKEAERFTAHEVADTDGVVAMEGALPLVEGLPRDAWAIVTSASRALARARLKRAGLPIPQGLVCADDVRQGKPSPEPYLLTAERLGKNPGKCVAVEDAPAGISAAHAAGMWVIGIATTHSQDELDCSVVVESLSALHVSVREGNHLEIRVEK